MRQQNCQGVCSSFLLTLLFSIAATIAPTTSAMIDCSEFVMRTQCQCSETFDNYKIQCPAIVENPKIEILVNITSSSVDFICNHFDDEKYQIIRASNLSHIKNVFMKGCPLPNKLTSLGIQKLERLYLENHNSTSNITRDHLSGLSNMKALTLNLTDLSLIRDDLFMDLRNLEYLGIFSSKISLTPNIFATLVNLKGLNLNIKDLQQLPLGIFRKQRMLEYLNLSNILLQNICKDFFADVTSINELILFSNGIESLEPDVFSLLTNLIKIDLSHNNFQYLPSELFAYNKKLIIVNMHNSTSLKALPSGILANLPNLSSAHISCDADPMDNEMMVQIHCDLNEIPHDLFANSSGITKISLAKNKLVTLNETLFEHQFLLRYLDLSQNKLKSLSKELFLHTNQLTVLKLSHNYLTEISRDLFSNLDKLDLLRLNNNHIITIDSDAFKYNRNLRFIYMENNRVNMTDAFENLRNLETLNLRNNTLRHIFNDHRMVYLEELDLSHNSIASINYDDLIYYPKNWLHLNLSFNQIRKINITDDFLIEFFGIKRILNVQLNNNPIACDCNLLPFLRYIRGDFHGISNIGLHFEISELVCNNPDNMKNMILRDIAPDTLLCPLHCPLGCKCWKRTYDLVLLVNCSSNSLNKVPVLPNFQPQELEKIELHVESNELTQLPIVSSSGYKDVTHIFAARNELTHINVNNLPNHLIYLDLSHNKLKELNEEVLNFFKRNISLKIALSENPWNCDCESKQLRQFVWNHSNVITDIDKMYCASPKNYNMLEYFNHYDICQQDGVIALLTWVVTISVVCFLITLTAALYYKYQTEAKIWMYKYNLCSWCVNEEELDKDKTYDAFVSYSSKDEEFVSRQLMPQLEHGKIRFKLCVHGRDFIVGGIIPDQIIRAVADSRRTIVVLSEHFIKSVWARMEFRLAHQAGLDEKRTKVIVIVYGEIGDISSLDLELQAYLKLTTYLEWGNPWFWERLRYIMPHPIRRNAVSELELNELSTTPNAMETDV